MYTEINRFKNINSYINSGLYKTASTYASMSENDRRDAKKRVNQTRLKNKNVSVENSDKIYHASSNKIEKFKLIPHYLAEDKGVVFGTPSKVTALTFASPWKDSDLDHYSINDGPLTLKEKYEGALEKVYKGKKGYLYELDPKPFIWNPSLMRSERVSYTVPKILGVREIPDVYEELLEEQRMNNLKLIKYNKPIREKIASLLTQRGRNQIKSGNFALPGGRYPIHDISHARNALARVAQHGTQSEQSAVKSAVKSRYPSIIIGSEKTAGKSGGKAAKSLVNAVTNTQKAETQGAGKAVEKLEKQKAQKKIKKRQKKIDDAQPSNNTSATITEQKIPSYDELIQEIRARNPELLVEKPATNIGPQRTQTQVPRSSTATPAATATVNQPIKTPSNTSQLNAAQRNALDVFNVPADQRNVIAGQMKKMPAVAPIKPETVPLRTTSTQEARNFVNNNPHPPFPNSIPTPPPLNTEMRKSLENINRVFPPPPPLPQPLRPVQPAPSPLNATNTQVTPKTNVPPPPPNTQVTPKTNVPPPPPNTQATPKTNVPPPKDQFEAFRMSDAELNAPNPTGFATNNYNNIMGYNVPAGQLNPASVAPKGSRLPNADTYNWFAETDGAFNMRTRTPAQPLKMNTPQANTTAQPLKSNTPQANTTSSPLSKVEKLTADMHGMSPEDFAKMDPSTRTRLTQGAASSGGLEPSLDPNSKNFQGKKRKNQEISDKSKKKIKDVVENPEEQSSGMSIPLMAGLGIGGIFAGSAIANYVGGHDKSAQINYRGMTFDDYNKPKEAPPGDKHKMVVLVKSQNKTKLVRFGHRDYKHNYSDSAKNNYLTRSAGIRDKNGNLTKDDPFSPNYWSRKVLWPESKKADGKALGHR